MLYEPSNNTNSAHLWLSVYCLYFAMFKFLFCCLSLHKLPSLYISLCPFLYRVRDRLGTLDHLSTLIAIASTTLNTVYWSIFPEYSCKKLFMSTETRVTCEHPKCGISKNEIAKQKNKLF